MHVHQLCTDKSPDDSLEQHCRTPDVADAVLLVFCYF